MAFVRNKLTRLVILVKLSLSSTQFANAATLEQVKSKRVAIFLKILLGNYRKVKNNLSAKYTILTKENLKKKTTKICIS